MALFPLIKDSISDRLVTPNTEAQSIDLKKVFGVAGAGGYTFSVQSSDPAVVKGATIDPATGILTFAYGTLGVSDITVTCRDLLGITVTDEFRIRVAGENAYTIAVLPDTQDYTDAGPLDPTFGKMTQWLVDNKDSHNIQFVVHVGDITQSNTTIQYGVADAALNKLDGVIPYSVLPGNHDGTSSIYDGGNFDKYFSPAQQAAANPTTFGGTYDQEPESGRNNYQTFTAPDGTKWLVLSLEFGAREDVLRWAGEVIEGHLDHRVILANHSYMTWAGRHDATGAPLYDEGTGPDYGIGSSTERASDGEMMYRALVQKYPNVTFTFSGHIFGDGAETLVSYNQYGQPVYQMMVNYQDGVAREITGNGDSGKGGNGGNGAIRLIVIDPDNGTMSTETYFVNFDEYLAGGRANGALAGAYRGHQESYEVDLGTPLVAAVAKAGNDIQVKAAGAGTAAVTLHGEGTLNPAKDAGLSHVWKDDDGHVVARGATPTLDLAPGNHRFTLEVADSAGRVSTDGVLVQVGNGSTLLMDNFNDGDAAGWGRPGENATAIGFGTPESFGLPAIPGGAEAVAAIPALTNTQSLVVSPNLGAPQGSLLASYSLVFDIYVKNGGNGAFTSLLQTDLTNTSDGDLFIRNLGNGTGGIGIGGDYEGGFKYDAWQRLAVTYAEQADGSVLLTKYVDGVKVGDQTISGDRFKLDLANGAALFTDEDGETNNVFVSSLLITDKVYTADEIAALGGVKAGGIVGAAPTQGSVQFDFTNGTLAPTFGVSTLSLGDSNGGSGSFLVKGSAASRDTVAEGQAGLEGRVYEQSDSANNTLVWNDPAAKAWKNYVYEATLATTDNDGIGVVFYYQDAGNHYRFVLNAEGNTRSLIKVQGGVETILAVTHAGTPFQQDMAVKVVAQDGRIAVFLDGTDVFGTVADQAPLAGGTVGFYSDTQRSSQFDDVSVNPVRLTAEAGALAPALDRDGDGRVDVTLDGGASYAPGAIAAYEWLNAAGEVVATGARPTLALGAGQHELTLKVTDGAGATATDKVFVEVVGKDRILLDEDFGAADSLSAWKIVDEGTKGGVGADGKASDWKLVDGQLVQLSGLMSDQLTWTGASAANDWQKGWSPLGDGVNVLRKGTYALYDQAAALEWQDYAVEATIATPDKDALGLLFYYKDAGNYYKLELDANGDYDRNPSNGAGSLFQLIQVKDGIEKYLTQIPAKYTPGEAFDLRVEVLDGKIQAYVDGMELFAYAIEDRAHEGGTIGLFSWGSAGVAFDDVRVYALGDQPPAGPTVIAGTPGNDLLTGTAGDDEFDGKGGVDVILGGAGADVAIVGTLAPAIVGKVGDTTVLVDGDKALVLDSVETLRRADGTTAAVAALAVNGNLEGSASDDLLAASAEKPVVIGGAGDDVVTGGAGPVSVLAGGAADDILVGGSGRAIAVIDAAFADVTIRQMSLAEVKLYNRLLDARGIALDLDVPAYKVKGPDGTDVIQADVLKLNDRLIALAEPDDRILLGDGDDHHTATAGDDIVLGRGGNDVIDGGAGNDILAGGAGDDTLMGGAGNDWLVADRGADNLLGGSGDDRLLVLTGDGSSVAALGGSGRDIYILGFDPAQGRLDVDLIIADFAPGEDVINLAGLRDKGGARLDLADILAAATEDADGSAVIDLGAFAGAGGEAVAGSITLAGLAKADLTAGLFDTLTAIEPPRPLDDLLVA
ncbi:family 16 glycoside hydrolase [Zavarzinia compransoris]|uniref:PKD/Chitinase domain-containing protein n=1 Tax=Zavarzinia compransoris TaxID=1264899 RepID=A0A317EFF0_9PROT|nr:family 16 glycoside hydrolase [Zavarzinia compransoris]PWR23905.1 hypothetical protein DKG75_04970 [Zavarzinia compransoris]TDP48149.1 Ca2+-binding RTX toxin-like protein [Zavarzinia compransoris]